VARTTSLPGFGPRASVQFGAFVVENRSGAGTIIGTAEVARGTPDGYVLLFGSTNTHVLQPLTASTRSYDPLTDFAPDFHPGHDRDRDRGHARSAGELA
jgi:hypothetical protein